MEMLASLVILALVAGTQAFEMELVFRATAGNGANVLQAWKTGAATTSVKPTDMKRSKASHYRHPDLSGWGSSLQVRYAKFALIKDEQEVVSFGFNATGTNNMNWFSAGKMLYSTYPSPLTSFNYFTIHGDIRSNLERNFFINSHYAGCDNDYGYVATVEKGAACSWDKQATYPQFLYSTISGPDYWNKNNYGRADYLTVSILP